MASTGLRSDYVCATRLTVHKDTRSIYRCPRITEDFEVYPYEIEDRTRAGTRIVGSIFRQRPATTRNSPANLSSSTGWRTSTATGWRSHTSSRWTKRRSRFSA